MLPNLLLVLLTALVPSATTAVDLTTTTTTTIITTAETFPVVSMSSSPNGELGPIGPIGSKASTKISTTVLYEPALTSKATTSKKTVAPTTNSSPSLSTHEEECEAKTQTLQRASIIIGICTAVGALVVGNIFGWLCGYYCREYRTRSNAKKNSPNAYENVIHVDAETHVYYDLEKASFTRIDDSYVNADQTNPSSKAKDHTETSVGQG